MAKRDFNVGTDAQEVLCSGLDVIARAVGSTMGPGGRPFGFDKFGTDMRLTSTFSKDGLTVLKSLSFDLPSWQAVLQYCKQAASHSVLASGDGTTSTIVLANAVAKAVRNHPSRYPQSFARLLEADAQSAIEAIKSEAIKGEDVTRKVALTSTNGDQELADVVLNSIKMSSAFGTILVEKNPASKVRYQILRQDGYSNCSGYNYNSTFALSASPNAAASKPIEWENPFVMLFNGSLHVASQLDPILKAWNAALQSGVLRNLLIVCYDVADEVVNRLMVLNRQCAKGGVAAFIVKPRLTAEINSGLQIMRDLAAYCGIQDNQIVDGGNYKDVDSKFFGCAKIVKITPNNTMFLGRAANHYVEERIIQNNSIVDEARSDFDRHITSIRNAELAEGLVKVQVGGGLLPDLQERADRFDDASKAAQACMRNGALPGSGCSYIRAGLLAGVHPALAEAFRSIHDTVLSNYGVESNPDFIPLPGKTISITNDGIIHGDAVELNVLDACDTVCAVIKNGVSLGVKVATIGGYSFRDQETGGNDHE
jgi:chaperonin GroEL